jgi:FKBP-type peptidyl-prolyl cis-trans isomerase
MVRSVLLAAMLFFVFAGCKKTEMQHETDERLIKEYLEKNKDFLESNNYTATRTSSGLYFILTDSTSNLKPQVGKRVFVNYVGKFLDDRIFDQNQDGTFWYEHGTGKVVNGFDEGISLMRNKEKAIILVPSHLGYGPRGSYGAIPPNAVLRFDLELVNIQ